jgi:hypothetical protein
LICKSKEAKENTSIILLAFLIVRLVWHFDIALKSLKNILSFIVFTFDPSLLIQSFPQGAHNTFLEFLLRFDVLEAKEPGVGTRLFIEVIPDERKMFLRLAKWRMSTHVVEDRVHFSFHLL